MNRLLENNKPSLARPSTSDNNLTLNLTAKSRNQSNGGYNAVSGGNGTGASSSTGFN